MPSYEISDRIGYSQPFHGYGLGQAKEPATVPDKDVDKTFQQPVEAETDHMAWLSPILAGVIMAVFTYGFSRRYKVDKEKATQVAVIMGGVTALGHGLSTWLHSKAEPIRQALPAAQVATAPPKPPAEPQI